MIKKIHILIHASFETSSVLLSWAGEQNLEPVLILRHEGDLLPPLSRVELLAVLGGPMSAYDPIPWIQEEIEYLAAAMESGKKVLGICLGSQLMAAALGSRVFPGDEKEIGWFDLRPSTESLAQFPWLPEPWTTFHWHGDTYSPPKGTWPLGRTDLTSCQGFFRPPHVLALQFHPEVTPQEIRNFQEAENTVLPVRENEELLTRGNTALFRRMLTRWKEGLAPAPSCQACADLSFPLLLENPLEGTRETLEFPDHFLNLRIPHTGLLLFYRNTERRLLECPDCGRTWRYSQVPCGRKDWVKESLEPLTDSGREGELKAVAQEARKQAEEYGTTYAANLPAILDAVHSLLNRRLKAN